MILLLYCLILINKIKPITNPRREYEDGGEETKPQLAFIVVSVAKCHVRSNIYEIQSGAKDQVRNENFVTSPTQQIAAVVFTADDSEATTTGRGIQFMDRMSMILSWINRITTEIGDSAYAMCVVDTCRKKICDFASANRWTRT